MRDEKKFVYNKFEHITHTKYFFFQEEAEKKSHPISSFFRLIAHSINRLIKNTFGYEVKKYNAAKLEERSFSSEKGVREIQFSKASTFFESYFLELGIQANREELYKAIEIYDDLFRNSAINNLNGGMGYNNGLMCFCFISMISPAIVIESGVWTGFTTFLIDKATQNQTEIKCFDINFSKLEFRSKKAEYYEHDVIDTELAFKNKRVLALFDDHVSHFDRLQFCLNNEIEYIILDDDVSLENVHSDGWPPIPTANMLMNYDDIPHKFKWVSNGRVGVADISGLNCSKLKNEYSYISMPDLYEITGYKNLSQTSFLVRKK